MPISEDKIKAANNRLITTDQPYWCASWAAGVIAIIVWPYLTAAQTLTIFTILLVADRQLSFISARFWRDKGRDQRAGYWEKWLFAGNLIAGTIWGLVCAVLYLQLPEIPKLLVGMMLILVIGGWSSANTPSINCAYAFSIPATTSIVIATLIRGEMNDYIIGLAAPIFLMAVMRHMREVAEAYRASLGVSSILEAQAKIETQRLEIISQEHVRLHKLLDAMPVPISVVNRDDGKLVYMNQSGLDTLGIKNFAEYAGDMRADLFVDPAARDLLVDKITRGEKIQDIELRLQRPDGSAFWSLYSASDIIYDGQAAVIGVFPDVTARREAEAARQNIEQELRKSIEHNHAQLKNLLDSVPAPVIVASKTEGKILYFNQRAGLLTNVRKLSETAGATSEGLFANPTERERLVQTFGSMAHVAAATEFQINAADGTPFWALLSGNEMIYEGEPATIGTFIDISGRREAEKAARQSEEDLHRATELINARLHSLLDSVPAKIVVASREDGRVLYMSSAALPLAGVADLQELPVVHAPGFFNDPGIWKLILAETSKPGGTYMLECQMKDASGKEFWADLSICQTVFEGQPSVIGTFADITGRREAEAARRLSEEKFRVLADNANDFISIYTPDSKCLYASPSVEKLLGYTPEEFSAKPFKDVAHPEDYDMILSVNAKCVYSDGASPKYIFRIRHKQGHWEWVESTSSIEKDPRSGKFLHVSSVTRVVTERIRYEQELKEARERAEMAGRAKSEFIAHMSHEIRTPLNAVIGFSEMMRDQMFGPLGSPRYVEYSNDIHNSGMHLLDLVNDILDLSKIESGKFELQEDQVELQAIVGTAIRFMRERAHDKHIALEAHLEATPELWCDRRTMIQVMLNVIGNAVKFTGEYGRISVESRLDAAGDLVLSVTDTGIGIAPEDLERVMQPFGQARKNINHASEEPGTGLGLPLSRSFVEKHDGSFAIASEPGIGTRITIILPASRVMQDELDKTSVSAAD